jgi:hypothetical protein
MRSTQRVRRAEDDRPAGSPLGPAPATVVVMADGRSAATRTPRDVLTPDRLSELWAVDASRDEPGAPHVNRRQR